MTKRKKKEARELLGRDAMHAQEKGPTYFKEGNNLVEEFTSRLREVKDPQAVVRQLREKNIRLAAEAQKQADQGIWDLYHRQKTRKQLIEGIVEAFGLELNEEIPIGTNGLGAEDEAGAE